MTRAAHHPTRPATRPSSAPAAAGGFLPFLTPVRGHVFAAVPARAAPVHHGAPAHLVREPANPADPLAIAVWADGDGVAWRIGYLERAVAARLAPRLDAGTVVTATLAGWWDDPTGRWRRPVVALQPGEAPRVLASSRSRVWGRPPASVTRPVSPAVPPSADVSGTRPGRS